MGEAITLRHSPSSSWGGMGNVRERCSRMGPRQRREFRPGFVGLSTGMPVGFVILIAMLMVKPTAFQPEIPVLCGARDDQRLILYPQPKRPPRRGAGARAGWRADPRRPVRRSFFLDTYYLHLIIISMIFLLPAHGLNLSSAIPDAVPRPGRLFASAPMSRP